MRLAIHDHLTNLFNRQHLSEVIVRIFENLKAEQKPFSIAMIELDFNVNADPLEFFATGRNPHFHTMD